MIVSFGDAATEDLYHGRQTARARRFPPVILQPALQKLDMLDAAQSLEDLGAAPGNRLEKLHGKARALWSIRVNDQWRIVFAWEAPRAADVQLVDYH